MRMASVAEPLPIGDQDGAEFIDPRHLRAGNTAPVNVQ